MNPLFWSWVHVATAAVTQFGGNLVGEMSLQYTFVTPNKVVPPTEWGVHSRWGIYCHAEFLHQLDWPPFLIDDWLSATGCAKSGGCPCHVEIRASTVRMNPRNDSLRARPFPFGLPPGSSPSCLPFVEGGPVPCEGPPEDQTGREAAQDWNVGEFRLVELDETDTLSTDAILHQPPTSLLGAARKLCFQLLTGIVPSALDPNIDWSEPCDRGDSTSVQPCVPSGKHGNTTQFVFGPLQRVPFDVSDPSGCTPLFVDGVQMPGANCPYAHDPTWPPVAIRLGPSVTQTYFDVSLPATAHECMNEPGHLLDAVDQTLRLMFLSYLLEQQDRLTLKTHSLERWGTHLQASANLRVKSAWRGWTHPRADCHHGIPGEHRHPFS
jgi:hypothetical protein